MISQVISIDILRFLLKEKHFSKEFLSKSMNITVKEIDNILNKKSSLERSHIKNLIKHTDFKRWKLFYEAIPKEHLSKKARSRLELCKQISDYLEKNH